MKVAIVGAGWAGMAAAVELCNNGHTATVFEASKSIGGRARGVNTILPNGKEVVLDNGQHILIGAYTECLALMRRVGVDPAQVLLNQSLCLKFSDNTGLQFPKLPAPLDALFGILGASGWTMGDKTSLLKAALGWQIAGFQCAQDTSVAELCRPLSKRVLTELIEPLCVSALNTPASRASAGVFLRVLKDALFSSAGGSRLLLPRVDLSRLFPQAAADWLQSQGGRIELGVRVREISYGQTSTGHETNTKTWRVNDLPFDAVILATSSTDANFILSVSMSDAPESIALQIFQEDVNVWCNSAAELKFEAITTVYAWAESASLARPMLTLRSHQETAPAQFAFDRGQLAGQDQQGLIAFVVSASQQSREETQNLVLQQAHSQLGLNLQAVQTVVEKRATFACTPGLVRPSQIIGPGLLACGDYVRGPYPATLEGAVRSGLSAARLLMPHGNKLADASGLQQST